MDHKLKVFGCVIAFAPAPASGDVFGVGCGAPFDVHEVCTINPASISSQYLQLDSTHSPPSFDLVRASSLTQRRGDRSASWNSSRAGSCYYIVFVSCNPDLLTKSNNKSPKKAHLEAQAAARDFARDCWGCLAPSLASCAHM